MPEQYYNTRVCSDHFVSGCPAKLYDVNNPDWAPSLKLVYECLGEAHVESRSERYERVAKRRRLCLQETETVMGNDTDIDCSHETTVVDNFTQSDLSSDTFEERLQVRKIEELKEENEYLRKGMGVLESEFKTCTLNEDFFKDDDKKVLFYTGLSTWGLLMSLFVYIKPSLQITGKSSLSLFQQLLVTLMRLRLNLHGQDLGYRFKVHGSTISRTFIRVIDVLFVKLKPLIIWPDRGSLRRTMPMVFRKHYPACVVIIDCFEIFLDRPTNLLALAQT